MAEFEVTIAQGDIIVPISAENAEEAMDIARQGLESGTYELDIMESERWVVDAEEL